MTDQPNERQENHDIRQLREKASRVDDLERQLAQTQRDLAFTRAGVDTSKGLGELIAKTYEGDPDPDAIREYAQGYSYEFTSGDTKVSTPQAQRLEAGRKVEQVMSEGTPTGAAPMKRSDWLEMLRNGQHEQAREAWEGGRVEGTQTFGQPVTP